MRTLLFVLCIATIGADRIDFLAGNGPLVLKPFLVLAPLIVILEGAAALRRAGAVRVTAEAQWFLVVQTALFYVLLVSVVWSLDTGLAFGRLALIIAEGYLCFLIVLLLANRPDRRSILVNGAAVGIALMLTFDVLQVVRWLNGSWGAWVELGGIVNIEPAMHGVLIPRPSGTALDSNRGGLLLLIYVILLWQFAATSRARSLLLSAGWIAMMVTLSRSTALAAIAACAGWLVWRGARLPRWAVGALAGTGLIVVLGLMLSQSAREIVLAAAEVLAGRVSISEGSSSDHLSLIARGWEVATTDLRSLFTGIGFGNSYIVLQDFFGGNKYANFHSMYITLLVEAGIMALVPLAVLMVYPFHSASVFRPIVLGMIFFNIFYQAHSEAMFWFVLALAWMLPELGGAARAAAESRVRIPRPLRAVAGLAE